MRTPVEIAAQEGPITGSSPDPVLNDRVDTSLPRLPNRRPSGGGVQAVNGLLQPCDHRTFGLDRVPGGVHLRRTNITGRHFAGFQSPDSVVSQINEVLKLLLPMNGHGLQCVVVTIAVSVGPIP
jgi:hypothetical protein